MEDVVISIEEFRELIGPLVGLTVSLPWKGYGSTIFLELGALAPLAARERHHKGEACICVEWDWRIEEQARINCGSSNSGPKIKDAILYLQGTTVESLSVVGRVPELVIEFSDGCCLRSMAMSTGDPEWCIKIHDGRWVYARSGRLLVGADKRSTTEEEDAAMVLAERTAQRWGTPRVEPVKGSCANCAFFVALDGHFHLLDYGCCVAEAGPLEGRAVAKGSGCPAFQKST